MTPWWAIVSVLGAIVFVVVCLVVYSGDGKPPQDWDGQGPAA